MGFYWALCFYLLLILSRRFCGFYFFVKKVSGAWFYIICWIFRIHSTSRRATIRRQKQYSSSSCCRRPMAVEASKCQLYPLEVVMVEVRIANAIMIRSIAEKEGRCFSQNLIFYCNKWNHINSSLQTTSRNFLTDAALDTKIFWKSSLNCVYSAYEYIFCPFSWTGWLYPTRRCWVSKCFFKTPFRT